MNPFLRRLVLIISLASTLGILPQKASATHLAGSDISYTCLGGNTYRVELTFYRDCLGSAAPLGVGIEFRSASCNQYFTDTLLREANTGQEISYPCPTVVTSCDDPTSSIPGIQEYRYSGIITFPMQCADWVISWTYCCRNCDITTMVQQSPCVTGSNPPMYIYTNLDNLNLTCNSSPVFSNNPISFVCVGQNFTYNHGVTDPDGDSLVYSLVNPLVNSTDSIPFIAGYSATNPITSSPALAIDPVTGDITFTPTQQEVGVLSVLVQEYRNGVLIGSVVRDMEIYVRPCTNNLPTATGINGSSTRDTTVCPGTSFCFDVFSNDLDANQIVSMTWNQGIAGATFTVSGFPYPTGHFCWTAPSTNVSTLPYSFTIQVADNNCPNAGYQTYSFNIYVNTPVSGINVAPISCNGSGDGSATAVTTSPTGDYSFVWTPGGDTSQTITGLAPGTYTVFVLDSVSGCSASWSATLTEPDPLTDSISSSSTPCSSNGEAIAYAIGGTPSYTYSWNTIPPTLNDTVSGLASGTYIVTITDAHNCVTTDSITISTGTGAVTINVDSASTLRCGTDTTGYAAVTASGGTPGYTYVWNTTPVQTGPIAVNLGPGTYTVTVTDTTGCVSTQNVTVNAPAPLSLTGSSIPAGCNLSDGVVMVSVTGGLPDYTYVWDTLSVDTPTLSNVPAGIYTVIVTDTNNCVSQLDITVSNLTIPAPNITVLTPILCNGDTNASVEITPGTGGGTSPFTFTWDGVTVVNGIVTNISPGTYNAGITDAVGCQAFTPVTITEPTALTAVFTTNHPSCFGDSSGTAIISAQGGTGGYSYSWSPFGGTDSIATDLPGDTYTVTVTDANGCTAEATTTVITTNQIQITVDATVNATCFGSADGSVDVTVVGGPYSYNWNNGYAFTEDLVNVDAGVYTLVVTDGAGCTETTTANVNQPPALPIDAGGDTALCAGSSIILNATLIGGTTGTWSSAQGVTFGNNTDPHSTADNLSTGSNFITWTVTDGNCQTAQTIEVYNYVNLAADAGPSLQLCGLTPVQLNGNVLPTMTGFWSASGVTFDNASLYNANATPGAYGSYVLTWSITNNACIDDDTLTMDVWEPVTADAGDFQTLCIPNGEVEADLPSIGSGVWTTQTVSTTVIVSPTNPTTQVNTLPVGSTVLVWTVTNGACSNADTVSVFYDNACDLELPSGFSPNGDISNDGYVIHGIEGYPSNVFRVFNRWGNEVYTKENYANTNNVGDWIGQNNNGEELPEGTYYVILEIKTTGVKKNTYVDLRRYTIK